MERKYNTIVICGIDRLGKDTLIRNIQHKLGHHFVLHYSKPLQLEYYNNRLKDYQRASFIDGFALIDKMKYSFGLTPIIFNRFHLGESTYAPLYRGYDGNYVFELEKTFHAEQFTNAKLILLTTSDFSMIKDDGESFDFTKKEQEQEMFIEAYGKSIFPNKQIIDVSSPNGGFKDPQEILTEALQ